MISAFTEFLMPMLLLIGCPAMIVIGAFIVYMISISLTAVAIIYTNSLKDLAEILKKLLWITTRQNT